MPVRVLCLHGSRQTKEIFEHQLSRFCDDLADVATFHFVDAPHTLPLITEEDDTRTLSWCSSSGDYTAGDAIVDDAMMPKGGVTSPAYQVLLGFSQGALMVYRYLLRHSPRGGQASPAQVYGFIVAGAPDPRLALEGDFPRLQPTAPQFVFGSMPCLHIIGKNDSIVSPAESKAFAEVCSSKAVVEIHEHAHSIPDLKQLRSRVHQFCEAAVLASEEVQAAKVALEEELEMIEAMYDCDCVQVRGSGTLVQLPLLPDAESALATAVDAAVLHGLERLKVCFQISKDDPGHMPQVGIVGGPSWHSVAFERWAAGAIRRTLAYMEENYEPGVPMLMPAYLFISELTQEDAGVLAAALSKSQEDGVKAGGSGTDAENVPTQAWAADDDAELRESLIAAAEAAAAHLLDASAMGDDRGHSSVAMTADLDTSASLSPSGGVTGIAGQSGSGGGGSCTLTIGLIGKPSAGKSTFFNAVTDPSGDDEAARVAAFPFTTIEPNIGAAMAPLYCPCSRLVLHTIASTTAVPMAEDASTAKPSSASATVRLSMDYGPPCDAAHGHVRALDHTVFRRHPVKVKDVAGLVKGAYQGKGKGNQFLNDLCDADVLVHVVDGAGATEADGTGCAPGQGSTLEDITWVRSELHSWIYDNLRAKWSSIMRFPEKLRTMFSGYRSTPAFVHEVLCRVGIRNDMLLQAKVRAWGPAELHAFVALYIRLRFPMIIALNKADLSTASEIAGTLRSRYPHEVFVSMSSRVECSALKLARKGYVRYVPGESEVEVIASSEDIGKLSKEARLELEEIEAFFSRLQVTSTDPAALTSTGVQNVLATALQLCGALLVFPVRSYTPVASLRHCLTFKPDSTAETVFSSLIHAGLLDGKLVRFEVVDATPASLLSDVRTLRKTEVIPYRSVLARVLSNKRQLA